MTTFSIATIVAAALFVVPTLAQTGMQCKDHPMAKTAGKGVIIRSWSYSSAESGRMYFAPSTYIPRYKNHTFLPVHDLESTKYRDLDLFTSNSRDLESDHYCTVYFQRRAKIYLLAHGSERGNPEGKLSGWRSEGWIELKNPSSSRRNLEFGLGAQKGSAKIPKRAYVFSKVALQVTLPTHKVLRSRIRGLNLSGYWSLLIGESDGSASAVPKNPRGMRIPAGGRCPDQLHDKWVTPGTDKDDPQTFRRMFKTYHPLWDPCYWCAYDHEHGSDAKSLMGYAPKYGYTALKNSMQRESHKGFKDIVLNVRGKLVYYGVHAQMSKGRRFGARHHSQVMAVVDKRKKGVLELEIRFKADYGHRAVRLLSSKQKPLTDEDEKVEKVTSRRRPRKQRIVNIYNPEHLDAQFKYRRSPFSRRGVYESWSTVPMCSKVRRGNEPTIDFKDMGLALRTLKSKPTDVVQLGRNFDGKFVQQPSTNREFKAKNFELSDSVCAQTLPKFRGKLNKQGRFYTNAYGTELVSGPAHNACAQYVKPGFRLKITGRFETMDTWYGLYEVGKKGHIQNVGYAIQESEN